MKRWRVVLSLVGAGLAPLVTPVATVHACSCMFLTPVEAVAGADTAFIGTVITAVEPNAGVFRGGFEDVSYGFSVERSSRSLPASQIKVGSHLGDGANCGINLDVGERWFIVADLDEGSLTTSSCAGSVSMDEADAKVAADIERLLPITAAPALPDVSMSTESEPAGAMHLAAVTLLAFAAVSVWVFARRRARV